MAFKVYTKTGDKGTTGLYGGARVPKYHIRIEAYGTIDELNSFLGWLRDGIEIKELQNQVILLKQIQDRLFTVGASLATDPSKQNLVSPDIKESDIKILEENIDEMQSFLPALKHFIIPGGNDIVSRAHICRTVARRAERLCVHLNANEEIDEKIIQYINRLSDYLFVLSRAIGDYLNVEETKWEAER